MGTRALLVLRSAAPKHFYGFDRRIKPLDFGFSSSASLRFNSRIRKNHQIARNLSSDNAAVDPATTSSSSSLQPPNVPRLAETARISLTPDEIEEYAPKIRQVIDWFGQLQGVDLNSVEPAIRADMEGENLREDIPETFQNRDAIIASIPSFEDPYIKVPKVLNKE